MKRIRELELRLVRAETVLIVVLVLLMLGLAGYNVFYRNVLVPLQKHWAHSGPPIETVVEPRADAPKTEAARPAAGQDDEADGFRGDFSRPAGANEDDDEDDDPFADVEETPAAGDDADGFRGAFGRPADADEDEDDEPDAEDDEADDAGGFGGAFGKASAKAEVEDDADDEDDDPFASLPEIDRSRAVDPVDSGPKGGPPPPGSFAAWAVAFIDALKLDWIDIFLRQLVIIVAFLGAMLATRRRKHINIDALSRLLSKSAARWVSMGTNLLAIVVCVVLAGAGLELVKISRAHPKDLMPWADEWTFQLMFPIGFSLLALHFVVRLLELATGHVDEPEGIEASPVVAPPVAPEAPAEHVSDEAAAQDEEVQS